MFASDIPVERRDELFDKMAKKIVELRLTPVAVVMLESSKPVTYLGSQLMVFMQPIVTAVFPFRTYDEVAALLEDRANVELFIRRIEALEDEKRHGKGKDNKNSGD